MQVSPTWQDLLETGKSVRVIFRPRPVYQGSQVMPRLMFFAGTHLLVRPLWLMDKDDPYPGEWALGAADGYSLLGRSWIASGDVVISPIESNLP